MPAWLGLSRGQGTTQLTPPDPPFELALSPAAVSLGSGRIQHAQGHQRRCHHQDVGPGRAGESTVPRSTTHQGPGQVTLLGSCALLVAADETHMEGVVKGPPTALHDTAKQLTHQTSSLALANPFSRCVCLFGPPPLHACIQPRFRSLWERYCRGVQAIVYVVDAADHEAVKVRAVVRAESSPHCRHRISQAAVYEMVSCSTPALAASSCSPSTTPSSATY